MRQMSANEQTCCLCNEIYKVHQNLYDTNGEPNSFYDVVETYFPEEMLKIKNNVEDNVLCSDCWNTIVDFHEFRKTIYEVHDNFKSKYLEQDYINENQEIIKDDSDYESKSAHNYSMKFENIYLNDIVEDREEEGEYDGEDVKEEGEEYVEEGEEYVEEEDQVRDDVSEEVVEEFEGEQEEFLKIEISSESVTKKLNDMENFVAEYMPNLSCYECHQYFNRFTLLRNHFKKEHPKLQFFVNCCERRFISRYLLVQHLRLHINPDLFKCDICGERKTCQRYLNNHKRVVHKAVEYVLDAEATRKARLQEEEEKEDFIAKIMRNIICYVCNRSFKRLALFRTHFEKQHPLDKFYTHCCERKFATRSALVYHLRLHDNPDYFKCDICGERKKSKKILEDHKQRKHKVGAHYKCDLCEERFYTRDLLKYHLETHSDFGTEENTCPHCSRQYTSEKRLQRHIATSHDKNLICEQCGEFMPNKYYVHKHAVMHGLAEERRRKSYKCKICDQVLLGMYNLKGHMESKHNDKTTQFICRECGKVSYSRRTLLSHKRSVHTERKHKCSVCGKGFRKPIDVTLHMVTHTKEKSHECPDCGKNFTRVSNMLHHRRYTHPAEYAKCKKTNTRVKIDLNKTAKKVVV